MKRSSVRPSVRPSVGLSHHSPAARRCGGFAAKRRAVQTVLRSKCLQCRKLNTDALELVRKSLNFEKTY